MPNHNALISHTRTFRLFFGISLCLFALTGCRAAAPTVLGVAPANAPVITVVQAAQKSVAAPVTLQGEMIEKCPVAGCWFKLRDHTGVTRVDTKAAGFVVTEVPLHAQMLVQGRADAQGGVAATGVRY